MISDPKAHRAQLRIYLDGICHLLLEIKILRCEAAAAARWMEDPDLKPETILAIDRYLRALDQSVQDLEEDLERRRSIIEGLSDPARELLRLRYLDGLTWAQVAEAVSMSAAHVQRLCNAALDTVSAPPAASQHTSGCSSAAS